jgi:DNA-binding PadR family transcriptional regulator
MFFVNALSKNRALSEPEPRPALTSLEFEILLSLAGMERHGYAIKKDIEARAGEASESGDALVIRPGTLYRAISRLVYAGLIAEMDEPPGSDAGDERRRYYRLTARGHEAAKLEARRLARQVTFARARKLLPRQA